MLVRLEGIWLSDSREMVVTFGGSVSIDKVRAVVVRFDDIRFSGGNREVAVIFENGTSSTGEVCASVVMFEEGI